MVYGSPYLYYDNQRQTDRWIESLLDGVIIKRVNMIYHILNVYLRP